MSRMPSIGSGAGFLPGEIDQAETFAESNVTVTHNKTATLSDGIELDRDEVYRTADGSSLADTTDTRGLKINPNQSLSGVEAEISSNTSGATKAYLLDSNGSTLATTDISALSAGDTFTISQSLSSATTYYLVADAEGFGYTVGYKQSETYPFTGRGLDITSGVYNSTTDNTVSYNFRWVAPIDGPTSGTTTVEWPYPDDVFDWGAAFFEAATDGETVNVYIEEYDGTSWVEIAGPISNTTDIPGDPARNVRFRVEFSRASTANNPRLLQIARQEVLASA